MSDEALTVAVGLAIFIDSDHGDSLSAGGPVRCFLGTGPVRNRHSAMTWNAFAFVRNPSGCRAVSSVVSAFHNLRSSGAGLDIGVLEVLGFTFVLANKEGGVRCGEEGKREKQHECAEGHVK